MDRGCKQNKTSETSRPRNEFTRRKYCFFKIMLIDYENQLRLPAEFVKRFKGQFPEKCSLEGATNEKWTVQIEKKGDSSMFTSGWGDFVKDNGVSIGDFLVFFFDGVQCFTVIIFGPNGCEKEKSYNAKKQHRLSKAACTSTSSEESFSFPDENEDTSTDETTPNERGDKCKSEDEEEEEQEEEVEELVTKKNGCKGRQKGAASRVKHIQKYYKSNRRNPTNAEKQYARNQALRAVIESTSTPNGHPMVNITMLHTHVYRGFHLTIPNEWALEHMHRVDHQVKLQVPGQAKKWTVGCSWNPSQCQIRAKWPKFVLDNNIEKDDVCVFELVHKGDLHRNKIPVMMVHIFRAVSEIVPLIVCRRLA